MADAGRDGGRIGLSFVKKLDFLLVGEGVGGIWESVSIVRSDSEGRGFLRFRGVSRLYTSLLVSEESHVSPSTALPDPVLVPPGVWICLPPLTWPFEPSRALVGEDDRGKGFLNRFPSDGLRNLATSIPRSAWSLSLEGDGLIDLDGDPVGRGSLEIDAMRGMPLCLRVDPCSLIFGDDNLVEI